MSLPPSNTTFTESKFTESNPTFPDAAFSGTPANRPVDWSSSVNELRETKPAATALRNAGNYVPEAYILETWEVEVFFDGDCPLCRREINWLRKRDRQHKVRFTDIAADDFDPLPLGKSHSDLMARIHGRLPSGEWLEGVEVFRRLYSAVGFGWLVAPTRLPGIRGTLDLGYRVFARYRLRLTGRCSADSCGPHRS
jgi:predicted DCC family thiol-disulfide oxidoreductase YuxK